MPLEDIKDLEKSNIEPESGEKEFSTPICSEEEIQKNLTAKIEEVKEELNSYEVELDMYTAEIDESNFDIVGPEFREVLELVDHDNNLKNYKNI